MVDKVTARETTRKAGVPTVPGSAGLIEQELNHATRKYGMVVCDVWEVDFWFQATAGGGGRGMRLAKEPGEFVKLLQQARSEAGAAFGNDGLYWERCIMNPRHIEFQRSSQKPLEEALSADLRKAMGDAAVAAAASIGYVGVGTREFLPDEDGKSIELCPEIHQEGPDPFQLG